MLARIHCAQEYCSQKASPRYPYTDDNEQQIRYPVFQTVIRTGRQLSKGSVNVKLQESFLRPLLVLKYRSLSYSTACMKCQDEKDLRCDNRKYLRTFSRNSSRTAQSICQKMFKAVSVEHGAIYIQRLFYVIATKCICCPADDHEKQCGTKQQLRTSMVHLVCPSSCRKTSTQA